jgi:uncharacterized small protein (DUF1192 family)
VSSLPRAGEKGNSVGRPERFLSRSVVRMLLILLLLAVVAVEEYSVITLRHRIAVQREELKRISVELQTLKNRRTALGEELASMKKITGDRKDGTTPPGNN